MFIDAHCHLEALEKECLKAEKAVENASKNNVKLIVANGVDRKTNEQVLEFSEKFENVKASLGLYPEDAMKLSEKEIEEELNFIKNNKGKIIAIGEVGMDFKFTKDKKIIERQKDIFRKIIKLGKEIDKPVIIHSRKAERECIDILKEEKTEKVLMHCFSGKLKLVDEIVKNGWSLSIPTCVKNSEQFQKIIEKVPIENLLCETDSPYLHPDKEFPNEPANVVESYKKISEIKNLSLKEVEKIVETNFRKLFG